MLRVIEDMARGCAPQRVRSDYGIRTIDAALKLLVRNPTEVGRYRKVEVRVGVSGTYRIDHNGDVHSLRRGRWTPVTGQLKGIYVKV
jgi:hypothetical protein